MPLNLRLIAKQSYCGGASASFLDERNELIDARNPCHDSTTFPPDHDARHMDYLAEFTDRIIERFVVFAHQMPGSGNPCLEAWGGKNPSFLGAWAQGLTLAY
jgi:hypothetical protein